MDEQTVDQEMASQEAVGQGMATEDVPDPAMAGPQPGGQRTASQLAGGRRTAVPDVMDQQQLEHEIRRDEGEKLHLYKDSVGILTAGVGTNMETRDFTQEDADYFLDHMVRMAICRAEALDPGCVNDDDADRRMIKERIRRIGLPDRTLQRRENGHYYLGWGYDVTVNGIPRARADKWMRDDIAKAKQAVAKRFPNFPDLGDVRQRVLVNMQYNLGEEGLGKFIKMNEAVEHNKFDKAVEEMLDSKWAAQVGNRAIRLAFMMKYNRTFRKDDKNDQKAWADLKLMVWKPSWSGIHRTGGLPVPIP